MKYSTPEKKGIKSEWIKEYIEVLENAQLSTHSLVIMRHSEVVFENYWEPFDKDFLHRMYSVTKSFVGLAIGFLEQDGLIGLDDPIVQYFPEETKDIKDENRRNQTIRHMLMMSTAMTDGNWFIEKPEDRVKYYFENNSVSRPSGTVFEYDSSGSFILCALVERLSGKSFMDFLREKLLDKIGFSKEAYMLKCPGGHSWGDSALICKSTDLLRVAMFCMNKGSWNGEQILNEEYVVAATSKQIDNNYFGNDDFDTQGYGYQFWMTYDNSFFFNGMGCQLAVCVPDKDIIMVYTGDNQGNTMAKKVIIDNFFNLIVRRAENKPFENSAALEDTKVLKLYAVKGEKESPISDKINGVTYIMNENPMGISRICFTFENGKGVFAYTNKQGDKEIHFGLCENVFSYFPQEGYSDEVGTQPGNRLYRCAASAAWVSDYQLHLKVQIIDKYFGILNINAGFRDGELGVYMRKSAEDFLKEYMGYAGGVAER